MNSTMFYTVRSVYAETDVETSDSTEPYEIDYPSTEVDAGDESTENSDYFNIQLANIVYMNNFTFGREQNQVKSKTHTSPLIVYERVDEKDHTMRNEHETCPVCYENYKEEEWLVYCPDCKNGLHEHCWRKCPGSTCIICRRPLKSMYKYKKK
jgi:hypothetical protein